MLRKSKFSEGSRVRVAIENDNENYDSFRDEILIVTNISFSIEDHRGYDEGINEPLYDLETEEGETIHCSLYEYELEEA